MFLKFITGGTHTNDDDFPKKIGEGQGRKNMRAGEDIRDLVKPIIIFLV